MNNKGPGYVYILTIPSFREDWMMLGKVRPLCRTKGQSYIKRKLPRQSRE